MKNKWLSTVAVVLLIGILILLRQCSGSKSLGVADELNADGIREDVAVEIARAFPDSEKTRAAATQLARAFQRTIDHPEEALAANVYYRSSKACLLAIEGDSDESPSTGSSEKIESMVVNSTERSRAYIHYNAKLSGHFFKTTAPDISRCEFDLTKMQN